ncbi:MAG TPA: peptidylprolyl isomerase, partial [Bacteroidota bacterium]|nr:peptidylprolyl isomerase [Bacteroidota bacterium]
LIEEIGKFGTKTGLNDLIKKYGDSISIQHSRALVMSIARFAIRNIISIDGVKFLLRFVNEPDQTNWHVVYALQRIGDHPEIRNNLEKLISLSKNHDPLVRMNLAALFGKLKNEQRCLDPLKQLAEFDADWRVQVNAIKALGNYDVHDHPEIVDLFERLFSSGNMYVGLTAISSFGTLRNINPDPVTVDAVRLIMRIGDASRLLEKIAVNRDNTYPWQIQSEAAIAMAKLEGDQAVRKIDLERSSHEALQFRFLNALGFTGSKKAADTLLTYLRGSNTGLARAALEGLQNLAPNISNDSVAIGKIYHAAIDKLQSNDVALITTSASILGDSLFLHPSSVPALSEALSHSRVPDDVEAIQEICSTLGKLKDNRSVESLKHQLDRKDRSIALAAASALQSITGKNFDDQIPRKFEPTFTDYDFDFLHKFTDSICGKGLSDTICVKIQTDRGEIIAELYKNYAPLTVMSFIKLAQKGFYRGLTFHRIVPNFVVQGGDPRGDGWGGPGYSIRSEFSPLTYESGTLGIASAGKDTEGSQFFITQSPQPHLDGRYTIFGKVLSGMDVVNSLQLDDHIVDIKVLP